MTDSAFDASRLNHLLPESAIGQLISVAPIRVGLSGAGVFAVATDRGEYVLRVQSASASDRAWHQQMLVWRRASDAGVAPALVHVDGEARAIISARVKGGEFSRALGDPAQRDAAIVSLIGQLRVVHRLDASGVEELDGVGYARAKWLAQRERPGFPVWARDLGSSLDDVERLLNADRRRVVGHNDVNPGNVLWDGQTAWLIDWEVASLAHPYYDVATLTTFLNLDLDQSMNLLALQEQRSLDGNDRAMLGALRQLTCIAVGCTMLGLVAELGAPPRSSDEAPTLAEVYARMRAGTFDLQSANGQTMFALAFLRRAVSPAG